MHESGNRPPRIGTDRALANGGMRCTTLCADEQRARFRSRRQGHQANWAIQMGTLHFCFGATGILQLNMSQVAQRRDAVVLAEW